MMSPPSCWSIMSRAASRETRNEPRAITSCWRSQSASVVSSSGFEMESPALLTTRSTPPNASAAAASDAPIADLIGDVGGDGDCDVGVAKHRGSFGSSIGVTVGDDDTRAFGGESLRNGASDARASTGHERDPAGERFGFRESLELRLFEGPVLDAELLGFADRRIRADRLGATHHVDRVDVELARNASCLLVRTEAEHADAGHEHDGRVGAAHRRAFGCCVTFVVGPVFGSVRVCSSRSRVTHVSIGVDGGRSSTIGRTLVRRKWSGQDVPSAASSWSRSDARKSSTTSASVKWPTWRRSVDTRPRMSGAKAAARARRSSTGRGWFAGTAPPRGAGRPLRSMYPAAVAMISSEFSSHCSEVAAHDVMP